MVSQLITVIRFGETNRNSSDEPLNQWYETFFGKIACNEETLDKLWFSWVTTLNNKRVDAYGDNIFEFDKPREFELVNGVLNAQGSDTTEGE